MKIAIIGTGYVGLVTGVCLAAKGHQVVCVDKIPAIVQQINSQRTPIYEPGLEELLQQVVTSGNLLATTDLRAAVQEAEVSLIAVGTPLGEEEIDLQYVTSSAREVGAVLKDKKDYHVVCVKSTVVPNTTGTLVRKILEEASGLKLGQFGLAMNPEFLREGNAVQDFMFPDRIVIGAADTESFNRVHDIYAGYYDAPIIRVNLQTAEMIKYTANALLATLISYANEIAQICEATGGIDVTEVLEGVTLDHRFNPRIEGKLVNPGMVSYLRAGCGYGGSCFPKDIKALIAFSRGKGYNPSLINAASGINRQQPSRIVKRLEKALGSLQDRRVAVLGLAFKPGTDDVRETPSISIINELIAKGATVRGADPIAVENMRRVLPEIPQVLAYSPDYQAALEAADAVVVVTSWPEYTAIPAWKFIKLMANPLIMDCRRALERSALVQAGCTYLGVGLDEEGANA